MSIEHESYPGSKEDKISSRVCLLGNVCSRSNSSSSLSNFTNQLSENSSPGADIDIALANLKGILVLSDLFVPLCRPNDENFANRWLRHAYFA